MHRLTVLSCLLCLIGLEFVRAADKYTDENRPYEFGFTIEGEQHRHEKKDENGIIMGEFGFITADGVYHVTVYATDENGNFKILSMKNIRVKPYPTAASTAASSGGVKKGHSIPFPPSNSSPVLQGPSNSKNAQNSKYPQEGSKPLPINKPIPSPAKSCSHCSIPTTTTKTPPPQLTDIAVVSKDRPVPETGLLPPNNYQQNTPSLSASAQNNFNPQGVGKSLSSSYTGQQINPSSQGFGQNNPQVNYQQDSYGNVLQNYHQQDISNAPKIDYPQQNINENPSIPQSNQFYPQNENNAYQNIGDQYYNQENVEYNNQQKQSNVNQNYPQQQPNYPPVQSGPAQDASISSQTPSLRNPKQYNDISSPNVETGPAQDFRSALASQPYQPVSDRPTLVAAQMQIVPKDTDIYRRGPGENEGLPSGLSKDDMSRLLYTFNYTVGFHGHHEEGYLNGAKKGYYYITGRNGIRTRVDYVADENGFRPTISQEVLDILSDDVPKPETEKDEKFGLKGYEFKWLYFPTNERK